MTSAKREAGDYDEGLRERLRYLVSQSSQRDIARKTGVSNQNINRYLKNVRPPASFFSKLVEALNVNPTWLLIGRGSPMLTDITKETASMAGDLLELVKAMSTVSKVQLGALAGKEHVRVLRELNDALAQHESLQERLNHHSRDIFAQLVSDLGDAVQNRQIEKVEAIIKAGDQVSRLCTDPELEAQYRLQKAHYKYICGDLEEVVKLQRSVLYHYLANSEHVDDRTCCETHNLALVLFWRLRIQEALNLSRACLMLVHGNEGEWRHNLEVLSGLLLCETGQLAEGRDRIIASQSKVSKEISSSVDHMLIHALFLSGSVDYTKAKALVAFDPVIFIPFALWTEDVAQLRELTDECKRTLKKGDSRVRLLETYAATLLDALKTKKQTIVQELESRLADRIPEENVLELRVHTLHIIGARVAHVSGNAAAARKELRRADAILENSAPEVKPPILFQAIHYRTALEAIPAETKTLSLQDLRRKATDFFVQHIEKGYGCFEKVGLNL